MRIVLGSAAFGLAYGTAIARDLPEETAVETMLRCAADAGFAAVDTARAYGLAEERIGRHLRHGLGFAPNQVMTKLSPLAAIGPDSAPAAAAEAARDSLARSRAALGIDRLERVLLHRASHLDLAGGAIWETLLRQQDAGRIGTLGVSVQTPAELERGLAADRVEAIQLPCNVLDRRFDDPALETRLAGSPVRFEARSVFLQGVLAAGRAEAFPDIGRDYDRPALVKWLAGEAKAGGGALDAFCAGYVAGLPWVDAIVFGVDDVGQIDRLARLAAAAPIGLGERARIRATRPHVPDDLLDPSRWTAATSEGDRR